MPLRTCPTLFLSVLVIVVRSEMMSPTPAFAAIGTKSIPEIKQNARILLWESRSFNSVLLSSPLQIVLQEARRYRRAQMETCWRVPDRHREAAYLCAGKASRPD